MRRIDYKKVGFLICILMCVIMCGGCSLTPQYYSKGKVKKFTKDLVADDVEYIRNEKIEGRKVFYFEDMEGRPFSVVVTSYRIPLYNAGPLPFYTTEIYDTYQVSIFQYERERIQEVLDDSGLNWSPLSSFDTETQEIDKIKEAESGLSLHMGLNLGTPIEKEDLKVIAQTGAQIDQILRFNYDKDLETKLNFEDQHLCSIRIVFCDDEDTYLHRSIEIPFSVSEQSRWTEETLYAHLLAAYEEYEREMRIYTGTPDKVVEHMEKKYGTEFVCDKDLGVFGTIGSPLRDNKVEVVLYEKADVDKEFQIRVTVYGTAYDGMFTYEDDYQDVLDYKETVRQFREGIY